MTCKIAANKGLKTSVIESGKESVWNALKEAELVAQVRKKVQQQAQLFKTVLDYANEGIIAVNRYGQITNFNASAAKITGIREDEALHQLTSKVLPNFNMDKVIDSGKPALRELISVGSTKVIANRVPIKVDNNITGAVTTFQDVQLEKQVRKKIYNRGHVAKLKFDSILGQSKAIKECITTAKQFSAVDSNVLIYGSTGTGKEMFAQSIHNASSRSRGPFAALNCGALPENLLESELFGYVEGAFTGAVRGGKPGIFELAHGGTISLDEISETSPHMQAKLLRVLQEKEVRRIGDHKVIPIDVRVIAATNRSLFQLVEKGDFRKDLYYRLNVLNLTLPDLAERKEDIPVLLEHFLKEICQRLGRDRVELSPEALKLLQKYPWPGNIRELQNAAERLAVQLCGIGQPMDMYRIIPELRQKNSLHNLSNDKSKNIKDIEYKTIVQVMKEVNYNKNKTEIKLKLLNCWASVVPPCGVN
ncbi:MAG: sigma 54-interacting transcriptional regulator [Desulfotomaculum sp.]|nr:sigma 54-interacting transcriptional regulator [Desulfotomaculum sp.]